MFKKNKSKNDTNQEDAFIAKDFNASAKVTTYTVAFRDNGTNLTRSVPYGTSTSLLTERISASFSPASGISSVSIFSPQLSGDTTYFGVISSNKTFPFTLLNNGSGNSQVVTIGSIYNNTRLHTTNESEIARFVVSLNNPKLYAAAAANGDTMNPSGTVLRSSSYGTLTAVGDAASPGLVTSFRTNRYIDRLKLTWTDPVDSDLSAVQIKYSTTAAISARAEGTLLANVAAGEEATWHTSLSGNTVYYYGAFTQDNVGKWNATVVRASGVPITNNTNGAFAWETKQQTLSRFSEEGLI